MKILKIIEEETHQKVNDVLEGVVPFRGRSSMGITGLLPLLATVSHKCTLTDFRGQRAAIDGFVWLHRACICCSRDVARGTPTTKFLHFLMKRVQLLVDYGINPLLVFDGSELPAKSSTNERRHQNRREHLAKATELDSHGLSAEAEAHYRLAIDISPEILQKTFQTLKKRHVDFIVAPYEADAQLSYLCRHKYCDFVITEDSDMIPYECPKTVFKLDNEGNCEVISYDDVFTVHTFRGFSQRMLLEACVLSGCDYLQSAPGIGIRTAIKLISTHGNGETAIKQEEKNGKVQFPDNYLENFKEAVQVFRSQRVYDPTKKKTVPCFEECKTELAGEDLSSEFARNLAEGFINPKTKEKFDGVELPERDEIIVQVPDFRIPIAESARKQFKSHFGSVSVPPTVRKVPIMRNTPLYMGKRCQTPPSFTLPSRRMALK